MARNRYGWQKRAKEMARKEKNDEKIKRRQGKITKLPTEEIPGVVEERNLKVLTDGSGKTDKERI